MDVQVSEADARLIAAAPDMLALLRAAAGGQLIRVDAQRLIQEIEGD